MNIKWLDSWPGQDLIRAEVEAYVDLVDEVLTDAVGIGALRGLYYKGSSAKAWDSALDYVPEVSDVDFHVWFRSDDDVKRVFRSMETALDVQARLERGYAERVPEPFHTPRPQFVVLNDIVDQPDYTPPDPSLVRVLKGEPLARQTYDTERIREVDCRMALSHEGFVEKLPASAIDKPGRLLWKVLRDLTFRVSPAGPRAVHLLGGQTELAWESNRTAIYSALIDLEAEEIAEGYAGYYLAGWRYFLSGWEDTDAGRDAIRCGLNVLALTVDVARAWAARREA